MERVETLVVGAGVVGLACARALAMRRRSVLLVECCDAIGTGNSSRNSEVIHAGIYYTPGSLKARLCVSGREALYKFCEERGVAHRRVGKLIVATTSAQARAGLQRIRDTAERNGVRNLVALDGAGVRALEPAVRCDAALLSPSSGIVDSHGLMVSLQADAEAHGAVVALRTKVMGAKVNGRRHEVAVRCSDDGTQLTLVCNEVVNCAGIAAVGLGRKLSPQGGACWRVAAHLARGSYFTLRERSLRVSRLVYPLPDDDLGGLGIHATVDLAGEVRFGPDVEWLDSSDPCVEVQNRLYDPPGEDRAAHFYEAVRRYLPGLPDGALAPSYVGVRPKLSGPGEASADFLLAMDEPRMLHLLGARGSPCICMPHTPRAGGVVAPWPRPVTTRTCALPQASNRPALQAASRLQRPLSPAWTSVQALINVSARRNGAAYGTSAGRPARAEQGWPTLVCWCSSRRTWDSHSTLSGTRPVAWPLRTTVVGL